jgi:hypothetical protein
MMTKTIRFYHKMTMKKTAAIQSHLMSTSLMVETLRIKGMKKYPQMMRTTTLIL